MASSAEPGDVHVRLPGLDTVEKAVFEPHSHPWISCDEGDPEVRATLARDATRLEEVNDRPLGGDGHPRR